MSSLRLSERIALAAIVAAGAVFLLLRWDEFPVGAGMDDAYYIEMARSMTEGRGPVIHLNQVLPDWRPDIFPLGFALLLSPLALVAGDSVQVFKLIPLMAWLGLFPICLRLARSRSADRRVALTALVCLNPWTLGYSVRVFSDLPFAVFSLAAVILFCELADLHHIRRSQFAAMVLVSGVAITIRTIGLALPVAMLAYWLWNRRWQRAVSLICGMVVVLLPHAIASGQAGGGILTRAYLQQTFAGNEMAGPRLELVFANLVGYLRELPVVMLPVFGSPLENLAARAGLGGAYGPLQCLLGLVLVGGIIWGLVVSGRSYPGRSRFLVIYLGVYAGVLLIFSGYPSGVQSRLLLPVLPLFFFMLLEAVAIRGGRAWWPVVALVLALSLGHNSYRATRPIHSSLIAGGKGVIDPGPGADWIRNNTPDEALVMVRWPLRQHIHFRRPVVGFGTIGRRELDQRVERFRVAYIFLGPGPDHQPTAGLRALLEADGERFVPVHRDKGQGITVFRVAKGS